jgi:hypothetical protein
MSNPVFVDLFVEDQPHAALLKPLVERVAREENVGVAVRIRSARGGHARALQEFELYQRLVEKNAVLSPAAELVVVGIDGNCASFNQKRAEIRNATRPGFANRVIAACPDPHVERWYLADPDSFHQVVGCRPRLGRKKCAHDHYKNLLARAIREAGHHPMLGGIEFAPEIAQNLDYYRAGKNDRSFKAFVDDLRARLRGLGARRAAGAALGADGEK